MPSTQLRQQIFRSARRLVVKLGSQLLAHPDGGLDTRFMARLAAQVAELHGRGYQVTLVSSGAIAMGRAMLGLKRRPKDIGTLQAVAAVGQTGLMNCWHKAFVKQKLEVGQVLLTRDGFEDRNRYLNMRNCISHLMKIGAVPIVNENDTVAVDEIRFGDNDVIAALVASALAADALILLTNVEGLQDASGRVVEWVENAAEARSLVTAERSSLGSGGMLTKLEAARIVTDAGEAAVIASGRAKNVLLSICAGEKTGTLFVPAARKLAPRQRWIVQAVRPGGALVVDDGAATALLGGRKSLLAIGIRSVVGSFEKGDVVVVRNGHGHELARGLINCSAEETRKIMGQPSSQFEKLLGRRAYEEVIHRDNLVVTAEKQGK